MTLGRMISSNLDFEFCRTYLVCQLAIVFSDLDNPNCSQGNFSYLVMVITGLWFRVSGLFRQWGVCGLGGVVDSLHGVARMVVMLLRMVLLVVLQGSLKAIRHSNWVG